MKPGLVATFFLVLSQCGLLLALAQIVGLGSHHGLFPRVADPRALLLSSVLLGLVALGSSISIQLLRRGLSPRSTQQ